MARLVLGLKMARLVLGHELAKLALGTGTHEQALGRVSGNIKNYYKEQMSMNDPQLKS